MSRTSVRCVLVWATDSESGFSAVFMSGSGSTIVCAGSHRRPKCIADASSFGPLHVVPANFITREEGKWYDDV